MASREAIDVEQARELVSDQLLWPSVRTFLWAFASQIHPTWLADLKGDTSVPSPLPADSSPRVQHYILSRLGVEPCFHPFPKEDGSRLLLLDAETLDAVAKWLGALLCADALRHVTSGATVRALKSHLPGIYPEVFSYTVYFAGLHLPVKAAGNAEEVVALGYDYLLAALSGLPEPLLHRFQLKLPKTLSGSTAKHSPDPQALTCIEKLLKLKFPAAHQLCC